MILRAERSRVALAVSAALGLLFSLVLLTPAANADDIPDTGPLGPDCVEFQVDETGTKSPSGHPDVDIELISWDSDDKGFDFSIDGMVDGQYAEASVKSGQDTEQFGPYSNGEYHIETSSSHENSHVRFCVRGEPTTTTESTTTTTEQPTTTESTTTTTEQPTTTESTTTTTEQPTTTESTTTTTEQETTTTDRNGGNGGNDDDDDGNGNGTTTTPTEPTYDEAVSAESVEGSSTTTTSEPEVEGVEVLPFTGADSDALLGLAVSLLGLGLFLVLAARGRHQV